MSFLPLNDVGVSDCGGTVGSSFVKIVAASFCPTSRCLKRKKVVIIVRLSCPEIGCQLIKLIDLLPDPHGIKKNVWESIGELSNFGTSFQSAISIQFCSTGLV